MRWMLRFLRQRDAGRDQQICVTLAAAYLSFYVANSPAQVSGQLPPAAAFLGGGPISHFSHAQLLLLLLHHNTRHYELLSMICQCQP